MTWLFFRLGEAKWQQCPTRWMLVTSLIDSSVLYTENGDIYIRRTVHDYPIPPLAWHETHQNSSTTEWDMQWWCYGHEKCAFVGMTVQRRLNILWKQTEGALATHMPIWRHDCTSGTNGYERQPLDCETDSCQCWHSHWICGQHLAWRPENAESFCKLGSVNAERWKQGFMCRNVSGNVITWQGYE